ncbi:uncharacterized protein BDV14DRAFT_200467 [Aspergillus stella-maris]|uniref:uncharacterized protein n=1 Tax=Aspergillus stella-maris TaxID=1810926 RepID=UPI003CCDF174
MSSVEESLDSFRDKVAELTITLRHKSSSKRRNQVFGFPAVTAFVKLQMTKSACDITFTSNFNACSKAYACTKFSIFNGMKRPCSSWTAFIYHYQIADATLTFCTSVKKEDYRLLISNPPKTMSLRIEVSSEDLQQIIATSELYIPIDKPFWVAETDGTGLEQVYEEQSRTTLTYSDQHAQQVLMLMLQSVVRDDRVACD